MSSKIVSLGRLFRRNLDWSTQELAEFYRVEAALVQAGLKIDTERGISDDGDPWFVFCRQDGEVIVHIARIDGGYLLAGSSYEGIARGPDIGALVRNLISRHPLVQMPGTQGARASNVFLHPAALLVAIVATAFFKSSEARALADGGEPNQGRVATNVANSSSFKLIGEVLQHSIAMDAAHIALILTAVSALSNLKPDFGSESIVSVSADDEAASISAPGGEVSPSSRSASSPQAMLLTSSELPKSEADGLGDRTEVVNASGMNIKALPLVAVLWDLSSHYLENRSVANEAALSHYTISSGSMHAGIWTEYGSSPVLVVSIMAAGDLPTVHAAKVNFPVGDGTVQTREVQHLDQLPAMLIGVLQAAVHAQVQWAPVAGAINFSSYADALITTFATPAVIAPTGIGAPATPDQSSLIDISPAQSDVGTTAATIHGATVGEIELQAILENFIRNAPDYSIISTGKGSVIVYDVHAVVTDYKDVKTVSFDFGDGSSLSLVGLPAALPHAYLLV